MDQEQQEKKSEQIMDFRYSIIAELLNPYLNRAERRALMRQKAGRLYQIPYSERRSLSTDCIRKWYAAFQRFGKEGLRPKARSDKGLCRALPAEESAALLEYLEQHPVGLYPEAKFQPLALIRKGVTLYGDVAFLTRHFIRAIGWLETGKVSGQALVTKRFRLDQAGEAFEAFKNKETVKCLFEL